MKRTMLKVVSLLCAVVMLLSVLPMTFASAAPTVVPTAVQIQWTDTWKNYYYGTTYSGNLYDTGCGIFSIVNAVGYLTGNTMSVTEVAQWAYDIKAFNYYAGGTDRTMLYPALEGKYGTQYGFTVTNTGTWANVDTTLKNHLLAGGVAIGHVYGHFIAVVGYNSSTSQFHIYDSAPYSARGTGNGDAWVTETWLTTSDMLTLDWYCLLESTGTVINNQVVTPDTPTVEEAAKLGTYKINTAQLNVRSGPSIDYSLVTTVKQDTLVNVTELADNGWGKFVTPDGIEGWANVTYYGIYIGIDVQACESKTMWGSVTTSVNANGSMVITNTGTGGSAVDFYLPVDISTATTPYFAARVTPVSGNGFYYALMNKTVGYFMMRDPLQSSTLKETTTASYMTATDTVNLNLANVWQPAAGYKFNAVRVYVAPKSSVTIDYLYVTAESGAVASHWFNMLEPTQVAVKGDVNSDEALDTADARVIVAYATMNTTLTV
ncbi:MAG: SH3 domain-containing protein, partial [Clostridia bacterium]|nr:SH3 domain-containing protein [Clostridia bacterium]